MFRTSFRGLHAGSLPRTLRISPLFAAVLTVLAAPAAAPAAQLELSGSYDISNGSQLFGNPDGYVITGPTTITMHDGNGTGIFTDTDVDLGSQTLTLRDARTSAWSGNGLLQYTHVSIVGGAGSKLVMTGGDSVVGNVNQASGTNGGHADVVLTADEIEISAVPGSDQWTHAVLGYSDDITVTARKLTVSAYKDDLHANATRAGSNITLQGFDEATLTSTFGAAIRTVVGTVRVLGNAGSSLTMSASGLKPAVENYDIASGSGNKTEIGAGTVTIRSVLSPAVRIRSGTASIEGNALTVSADHGNAYEVSKTGSLTVRNSYLGGTPGAHRAAGGVSVADSGRADIEFAGAGSWLHGSASASGGSAVLKFSGQDAAMEGDLTASGSGSLAVLLTGSGSSLTGKSSFVGTEASASVTAGAGSVWNMTGDSTLTSLALEGGTVDLAYGDDESAYRTLTAQTLTGSGGLLRMRAVVTEGSEAADRLVVTGAASGSHRLLVSGTGEEPAVESMTPYLVQAQHFEQNGSDATFALAGAGVVDVGNYVYELAERDSTTDAGAKEWYLKRYTAQPGEPEPAVPDEPLSPSAETVLAFNGANTMAAFHWSGLDDLRKRLGEVRAQGDRRGAWASAGGSVSRTKNFPGLSTRIESFRLNVGADAKVSDTWLLGGSLRFTTGDEKTKTTFAGRSSADVHSEGLSLYATKIWDSGAYLDLVASTDLFHQEVRGTMIGGRAFKGNFSAWGWGLSAEAGHQLRFGEKAQWFAEPSVQLSYYRADGPSYTLSNGMKVDDESADAITGRAGTLVGRRFYDETGAFDGDAYIRAGVIHQFGGGHSSVINGESFALRGLGSRWYAGVGGEIRVGRDAKIYGYAETQHGNRYSTEIEGRVGFKLLF